MNRSQLFNQDRLGSRGMTNNTCYKRICSVSCADHQGLGGTRSIQVCFGLSTLHAGSKPASSSIYNTKHVDGDGGVCMIKITFAGKDIPQLSVCPGGAIYKPWNL